MNLAICDDQVSNLHEYEEILTAILEKHKIAASIELFHNCKELMFALEDGDHSIDVIFLDINMPEMNGVEMAHWIRERNLSCEIIFLTVSQDHMLHAFDVEAFHYVVKGVTTEKKLEEICLKAVEKVTGRKREVLTVSCAGESRVIPISEILYFEVQNYIIIVHYGDDTFEFYSTLGKIESSLMGHGFIRTHRSYVVNTRQIHAVMRQELELSNGDRVPVGRKYTEDLRVMMQKQAGQYAWEKSAKEPVG